MQYYILFGLWPDDERSRIGEAYRQSQAWVYNVVGEEQTEYEEGVSVYETKWDEKKNRWVIPSMMIDSYMASLDALIDERRDLYLVTGDEVDTGSDGEPVLRNLKLIKPLQYSEIYNDHCYDEDTILHEEPSPIKPWIVSYLFKAPGKAPKIMKDCLTAEKIQKKIGGYFQLQRIGGDVAMLVRELDFPDPKVKANFYWPSLGTIFGPVIFTAIRSSVEMAASHKQFPWPWFNPDPELDDEDQEKAPGEDFRSLHPGEIEKLKEFIKKLTQKF